MAQNVAATGSVMESFYLSLTERLERQGYKFVGSELANRRPTGTHTQWLQKELLGAGVELEGSQLEGSLAELQTSGEVWYYEKKGSFPLPLLFREVYFGEGRIGDYIIRQINLKPPVVVLKLGQRSVGIYLGKQVDRLHYGNYDYEQRCTAQEQGEWHSLAVLKGLGLI